MANTAKAEHTPAPLLSQEEIDAQIKPLSKNGFARFFQKIGRGWLKSWYSFSDKKPGLSKVLHMLFFFVVFSIGVTVVQMLLLAFLPNLLGTSLAANDFMLGGVQLAEAWVLVPAYYTNAAGDAFRIMSDSYGQLFYYYQGARVSLEPTTTFTILAQGGLPNFGAYVEGYGYTYAALHDTLVARYIRAGRTGNVYAVSLIPQYFMVLGSPLRYRAGLDATIRVVVGGGLGYFIAVMIATFVAQIINFPLQRNITFRSKGNIPFQILFYFIGWLFIQPFTMMIQGLWRVAYNVLLPGINMPFILVALIDAFIIGGVSMIIFFFIFMVIFTDRNKVLKGKKAAYEKAQKSGDSAKIAKAEKALKDAEVRATYDNARKTRDKTHAQASAKAMSYNTTVKNFEKAGTKLESLKDKPGSALAKAQMNYAKFQHLVPKKHQEASDAKEAKENAAKVYEDYKPEYDEYIASVAKAA